jgi:hypothetical protein
MGTSLHGTLESCMWFVLFHFRAVHADRSKHRVMQSLLAWQHLTKQERLEAQFLEALPPDVADALALPPKQRNRDHVRAIHRLAIKQRFARTIPQDALFTACRYMTYEVLTDQMVCFLETCGFFWTEMLSECQVNVYTKITCVCPELAPALFEP